MIGKVVSRSRRPHGLLRYLFGPGRHNEHTNPHLVAAWCGDPVHLEPPGIGTSGRHVHRLAQILEVPIALAHGRVPDDAVWHCVLRAAPGDPDMGVGAWQAITAELMHRTGLSEYGREDEGVRWVSVHHGDNHVHIVAVLARMDGRPVRLHGDWYRIAEAMAWAETTYGLTPVARGGPRGTAERRATRAEAEKAAREYKKAGRTGRPVPTRTMLRRLVEQAVAAARTETEFFDGLAVRGIAVRLRYSTVQPTEVTGYAVGLRSDTTGVDNGPVWFGGGKLAPNLTLPRLRARWPIGTSRLTGRAMTGPTARVVLAREVLRAARASRTEDRFFAELYRAGLLVHPRSDPSGTDRMVGYAVTLPGLADKTGQPVWFGGATLAPELRLGEMRARWRAGRTGAPPGADMFAGADAGQIYAHAVAVAQLAAAEIATARSGRADIAYAAADLLVAAAQATGNPELRRAADGLNRAARAPWSRPPVASPPGAVLRTAAYLLAACAPVRQRTAARRALIIGLVGLARAVARLRAVQQRQLQADAARNAAARLAAVGGPTWGTEPPTFPVGAMARPPNVGRSTSAASRRALPAGLNRSS
jgi:hypothetical protein